MTYAIQAEGLVKRFGETTALAGAALQAGTGTPTRTSSGPTGDGRRRMGDH
jgi:oleandomycin transport system ATP-binding protein